VNVCGDGPCFPLSRGTISIIDTSSNMVTKTVQIGYRSSGIAITPDGAFAYVANQCGEDPSCASAGTVSVISTATQTITQTIPIGQFLSQFVTIAIIPDGRFVYVANTCGNAPTPCPSSGGTVSIIDTSTNSLVGSPISVGAFPGDLAVTPDGKFVYAVNQCGEDPSCASEGTVSVISTATNAVIATVPVGKHPGFLAITPGTAIAFSSFTAKLELRISTGSFDLNSAFTLGATSDGINPVMENVTLQIGPYFVTVPPGSFTKNKKGAYVFEGTINGVWLEVRINPKRGNKYTFQAEGSGAALNGIANPVTINLTIGNETGTTQVNAHFRKGSCERADEFFGSARGTRCERFGPSKNP